MQQEEAKSSTVLVRLTPPGWLVLPVLGFTFTQPRPTADAAAASLGASTSLILAMSPVGTSARAHEVDGEFVVLKGSTARKQGIAAWTSYKALRDQLVQEGKLVDGESPGLLVFAEDVAFNSPSAAAAVFFGGSQSGPRAWRTEDGAMTYKDWQEAKLKQAGVKLPGS